MTDTVRITVTDTVCITVTDGYAIYADGQHHVGGETVEVPADLAEKWTARGWARGGDEGRAEAAGEERR